jgi:hypothetical protein
MRQSFGAFGCSRLYGGISRLLNAFLIITFNLWLLGFSESSDILPAMLTYTRRRTRYYIYILDCFGHREQSSRSMPLFSMHRHRHTLKVHLTRGTFKEMAITINLYFQFCGSTIAFAVNLHFHSCRCDLFFAYQACLAVQPPPTWKFTLLQL